MCSCDGRWLLFNICKHHMTEEFISTGGGRQCNAPCVCFGYLPNVNWSIDVITVPFICQSEHRSVERINYAQHYDVNVILHWHMSSLNFRKL